jgi:splicing factor 3B subunit 3
MFLYSLSSLQPSSITQAILGAFSGKKQQEIVVAQGSRLSLLRPDATQGKVHEVLTHDMFGIIRCMAAFRLAGSSKGMSSLRYHISLTTSV